MGIEERVVVRESMGEGIKEWGRRERQERNEGDGVTGRWGREGCRGRRGKGKRGKHWSTILCPLAEECAMRGSSEGPTQRECKRRTVAQRNQRPERLVDR